MHAYLTILVGNLTDARRMLHLLGCGIGLLLAMPGPVAAGEEPDTRWHPVADIKSAAENYLKLTVGNSDARIVPTAGHLDPRLQLPRCSAPLAPYIQKGAKRAGRSIVGVRCPGSKPWNIYLPVYIATMEDVLVTSNPLPRGHLIGPADIEIATRDVSGLTQGYMTNSADIVGRQLTRSVTRGVVLTPAQLKANVLITRGQSVTLLVNNGALNISMAGKALMDGTANQRIRVENTGSGRIVEGLVRSEELVQVLVQ